MKKLTILALCCLTLFTSCTKDSEDTKRLETELAGEKSKTVVDIKKEGNNLIIVYSNGTTSSVAYTDAIKGNIESQNGVGIESINYNEQTGILSIKLTNGEVTEFKIFDNGTDWKAVLVGDTNGRLFVQEALLGSVPVIKAEYNSDYQLTYLESNQAVDMQIRKAFDLTKSYTNGTLDKYTFKRYATSDRVNYSYSWGLDESYTEVTFAEDKGYQYIEANSDGTYTLYTLYNTKWENGAAKYIYKKYAAKAIVLTPESTEYNNSELVRKKSETEFHYYHNAGFWNTGTKKVFVLGEIVTLEGKVSAGDLQATKVVDVDTDSQGRITKMYEASREGVQPHKYISYEYNTAGLVKTTKTYFKNAKGAWIAEGGYDTYNYDSNNRLISTTKTYSDGSEKEVQKATYDKNGNPTEIWAWQPAIREYIWGLNPETGERGYLRTIREAGLYKVATLEYDYTFKNFLGNTVTALVPELEGYKAVNAIKRVTTPSSYSFANIEYKDFDEYGYPRRMKMDALDAYGDGEVGYAANVELVLHYKVKAK